MVSPAYNTMERKPTLNTEKSNRKIIRATVKKYFPKYFIIFYLHPPKPGIGDKCPGRNILYLVLLQSTENNSGLENISKTLKIIQHFAFLSLSDICDVQTTWMKKNPLKIPNINKRKKTEIPDGLFSASKSHHN